MTVQVTTWEEAVAGGSSVGAGEGRKERTHASETRGPGTRAVAQPRPVVVVMLRIAHLTAVVGTWRTARAWQGTVSLVGGGMLTQTGAMGLTKPVAWSGSESESES